VDDWGKLLGDTPASTALLDRPLHHADVLKVAPELADESRRFASGAGRAVKPLVSGRPLWRPVLLCRSMAGFKVSTEGETDDR
jgi:hypothetical protein